MTIYQTPSGTWRADIRARRVGERGLRYTKTFDTKHEALSYEKDIQGKVKEARKSGLDLPDTLTLKEALRLWWEDCGQSFAVSNRDKMKGRMKKWQDSTLGDLPIKDLSRKHVRGWIDERKLKVKECTVKKDLSVLTDLYLYLDADLEIQISNPSRALIKKLSNSDSNDRRLSAHEFTALDQAFRAIAEAYTQEERYEHVVTIADNKQLRVRSVGWRLMHAAFLTAIECAARQGRVFAFTWRQINFYDRVIEVEDLGPDNKKVPALIPMTLPLVSALKGIHGPARIGAALDAPVFGPLNGNQAYKNLQKVCGLLGIQDLCWHDLRHESCSRMAEKGWTAPQMQAVSGHKTLAALNRYIHIDVKPILDLMDRTSSTGT